MLYLSKSRMLIYTLLNFLNFFQKSDGGHCEYCLGHTNYVSFVTQIR